MAGGAASGILGFRIAFTPSLWLPSLCTPAGRLSCEQVDGRWAASRRCCAYACACQLCSARGQPRLRLSGCAWCPCSPRAIDRGPSCTCRRLASSYALLSPAGQRHALCRASWQNVLPSSSAWSSVSCGHRHRRRDPAVLCRYAAKVELSKKVLDTPDKLRDTLLHELCHAVGPGPGLSDQDLGPASCAAQCPSALVPQRAGFDPQGPTAQGVQVSARVSDQGRPPPNQANCRHKGLARDVCAWHAGAMQGVLSAPCTALCRPPGSVVHRACICHARCADIALGCLLQAAWLCEPACNLPCSTGSAGNQMIGFECSVQAAWLLDHQPSRRTGQPSRGGRTGRERPNSPHPAGRVPQHASPCNMCTAHPGALCAGRLAAGPHSQIAAQASLPEVGGQGESGPIPHIPLAVCHSMQAPCNMCTAHPGALCAGRLAAGPHSQIAAQASLPEVGGQGESGPIPHIPLAVCHSMQAPCTMCTAHSKALCAGRLAAGPHSQAAARASLPEVGGQGEGGLSPHPAGHLPRVRHPPALPVAVPGVRPRRARLPLPRRWCLVLPGASVHARWGCG